MTRFYLFAALCVWLITSASLAQETRAQFRAVVLSDINGSYGSLGYPSDLYPTITRIVGEWQPDIVLSAGDLVAGQSHALPDARFAEMWAAFERDIHAPLREAAIPFAFALGNHDASAGRAADGSYAFARERDAAAAYWQAHRPALEYLDDSHFPFYYSFTFEGVFFVVIDASSHIVQDETWLERTLASPAAQSAAMRIVIGHLPLYGVAEGRSRFGEVIERGPELHALFERHNVALYLSGHHHAYYPARRGDLELLHSGAIGGRDYLGHPGTARNTVTVMDVDIAAGRFSYTTFDTGTGEAVALESLPERLEGYNGVLTRVDLAAQEWRVVIARTP